MKLISDVSMQRWLENFDPDPDNFDWDAGNAKKNEKHGVSQEEIVAIIESERFVFFGRIIEPAHDELRWIILGESPSGRPLTLVFTRRGDKVRPISCRPMRLSERRIYETKIKGLS